MEAELHTGKEEAAAYSSRRTIQEGSFMKKTFRMQPAPKPTFRSPKPKPKPKAAIEKKSTGCCGKKRIQP